MTTIRPMARRKWRVVMAARLIRGSGSSAALAAGDFPGPASKASCRRPPPFVAVMDADLQHDETIAAGKMLAGNQGWTGRDLVVASRKVEGGTVGEGLSSRYAPGARTSPTAWRRKLLNVTLTDPMSGFFMVRREKAEALAPRLSPQGFKILLDLVSSANGCAENQGTAVHVPRTPAWRKQARYPGDAGLLSVSCWPSISATSFPSAS